MGFMKGSMIGSSKRLALLLLCPAALLCAAGLPDVHTVYVLKMSKGLDQFLASRLTEGHVFQIVTDPKLADAILTDQIGEAFEVRLDELLPPPEPVKPAPPAKDEKAKPSDADLNPFVGDTVNKLDNPAMKSSFGRSRGTIFLVDPKSKQVVWSMYQPSRSATSNDMNRTATDIVSRLKKDLKSR